MSSKQNRFRTSITRVEHFNAAHRLDNPKWDDETNRRVFGKCNNQRFHGHNYEVEVKVTGFVDPETGFVMDAKELSDIINTEVLERFDHMNLNLDVEAFKYLNPTAENIVIVIYDLLRKKINSNHDLKIKLYETPRNFVEYPAN
jgi:6-pyruvoyltetrahydropterin/6-carboxytetrahydropterin synthase